MKKTKAMLSGLFALSIAALIPISSQAALIEYDLAGSAGPGLLTGNVVGGGVSSGASGGEMGSGITFDDVTKVLTIHVGWGRDNGFTDLAGQANVSHIHGPAGQGANAGVLVALPLMDSSASAGYISTTAVLTPANEAHLVAGNMYINVHSTVYGGGEIRGNIVAIPEPSSLALAGIAGGALLFFRRRMAR